MGKEFIINLITDDLKRIGLHVNKINIKRYTEFSIEAEFKYGEHNLSIIRFPDAYVIEEGGKPVYSSLLCCFTDLYNEIISDSI